jgi:hypothetical protein
MVKERVFSISVSDQIYGQVVAEQLNARYANVSETCAGKSAYFCNGLLARVTKATTNYHAWDPSPTSIARNGVAFSYLRQDLTMARLYGGQVTGFIFKSLDMAAKADAYPTPVRCSFPFDGATDRRYLSCGHHDFFPGEGDSCMEMGIDTLAKWRRIIIRTVTGRGINVRWDQKLGSFRFFSKLEIILIIQQI